MVEVEYMPYQKLIVHEIRKLEVQDFLQMVVSQVKEKLKKEEIKQLDPALASLVKLLDEGLLESFILISRAEEGIAKDYESYRDAHRDKIGQYIAEWIIQPAL